MHLQVQRFAGPCGLRGREHTDFDEVIHRNFGLDARGVHHHLARLHVERHLPGACLGLLRGYSLRRELPERVRFKEIDKQIVERLRYDCLKFPVEIERGCQGRRSRAVPLEQAP